MTEQEGRVDSADELDAERTALCQRCLSPVDPSAYYCQTCGEATSNLTPYLPYVNIKFSVNFYRAMWRKAWYDRTTHFIIRLLSIVLIVVFAPIMLIGLPFVLAAKRKVRTKDRGTDR